MSTEHLLIAIAQERDGGAARVLAAAGVPPDALYRALVDVRGNQRVTDPNPEDKYQALERYSRDLTEAARKGKLDPVIGRDEEIRRVVQVLSRRNEDIPCHRRAGGRQDGHRGRPGQRIVAGDVPEGLKDSGGRARSARSSPARSTVASSRTG